MLLTEFLEPLGVSQVEAARRMGVSFQRLNAIVKGRRAVTADTALLLEALTGWEAQIWLSLQTKVGPVACLASAWESPEGEGADHRGPRVEATDGFGFVAERARLRRRL